MLDYLKEKNSQPNMLETEYTKHGCECIYSRDWSSYYPPPVYIDCTEWVLNIRCGPCTERMLHLAAIAPLPILWHSDWHMKRRPPGSSVDCGLWCS